MQAAASAPLLQRVQRAYATLQVREFRACELCQHGRTEGTACLRDSARPVPVSVARSRQGGCGPNAEHMSVPAWGLQE